MSVVTGVLLHATGASFAALCYTPQKKVVQWSWQTYWLAQALVCWLLLPILVAFLTIPHLTEVLHEAPASAMWKSFGLGIAYGVGGTAFGLAIRYVGYSLTYAISIGISCVLGTLLPPFVRGELGTVLSAHGAGWIIIGMCLGVVGIALCGVAGRFKELDLAQEAAADTTFSLSKGLPLCLLAGVLSALYGFSLDQGQPIADVAAKYGAGDFQGNVIYLFSNTGAFLTTLVYCLYLHQKQRTFGEYTRVPATGSALTFNYALSILTGLLWYSQFFFYGLGHVRMGNYKFTSWAVHMIMLVLFSNIAGLLMKEWAAARGKTIGALAGALAVLVVAVLALTYGNYIAS
ncbi:L-rhamnose-H+ transport protein [Catalinimonas alkaloidigena]|uniref:L-rhamnose-H+ transport protein n=1 Tax=Catalinimonas alkaloidigena TaxID=1075417 RepID=A0A1G9LZ95_9BACT|nr:L-rhamnose/proton symporter RhaT [Catalinimonas alkaloidigena]SDL67332.1 L-rhamnose-H+ transport protein [Catalinimonas alkaloidigena]